MVLKFFLVGFFCLTSQDCIRISGPEGFPTYDECIKFGAWHARKLQEIAGEEVVLDIDITCVDAYELPRLSSA